MSKKKAKQRSRMFPKRVDRICVDLDRVMFIDPGTNIMGWAFWEELCTLPANRQFAPPTNYGDYRAKRSKELIGRMVDVWAHCDGLFEALRPEVVVVEMPATWSGDRGAVGAASGATLKLSVCVGGILKAAIERGCRRPVLITPKEWKGQLPKNVSRERVLKRLGVSFSAKQEDVADAVAMGLAAQGGLE